LGDLTLSKTATKPTTNAMFMGDRAADFLGSSVRTSAVVLAGVFAESTNTVNGTLHLFAIATISSAPMWTCTLH